MPDKTIFPPEKFISIGSKPKAVEPIVPVKVRFPTPVLVKLLAVVTRLPDHVMF